MIKTMTFSLVSFMVTCSLSSEISRTKCKWCKWELTYHVVLTSVCMCNRECLDWWEAGLTMSVAHSLPLLRRKQWKLVSGSRIKMVLNQNRRFRAPSQRKRQDRSGWIPAALLWTWMRSGKWAGCQTRPETLHQKQRQQDQKFCPWLHSELKANLNCIIRKE